MEKKQIKDFLPDEVQKRINDTVRDIFEDFYADQDVIEEQMERFEWIWDEETTAEPEGVKPRWDEYWLTSLNPEITPDDTECFCGECDIELFCLSIDEDNLNFCPNCGVRIDWEGTDEKEEDFFSR